jgi:hypothetical protein
LNQGCVLVHDLESMSLRDLLKIVFQHGVIPGSSQTKAQGKQLSRNL